MALTVATVETAIEAIMNGAQSATVDGMTYTAANLQSLIDLRGELQKEALNTAGTRPAMRGFNFGAMGYSGTDSGTSPTPVTPNLG